MTSQGDDRMTTALIGVDVGGTTTAGGLVTPDGDVLAEEIVPTHHAGAGTAMATITAVIERQIGVAASRGVTVAGLGVGVPAIVDAVSGRIRGEAHHVPELADVALGAVTFGPARGAGSLVMLAPGTGFGAGIVLDGRLVRGVRGFGGELGHAPVKFDGRPCWCGGRGCLAVYASGRGIAEAARALAQDGRASGMLTAAGGDAGAITASLVFRMAAEGDPVAAALVEEACEALGAMIGIIVNGLNPEVVVITGGVAGGLLPLESRLRTCAAAYAFREALDGTRIVLVPGDKRRTTLGAAALVLYEQARRGESGVSTRRGRAPRTAER